jgi:hypothetical protein
MFSDHPHQPQNRDLTWSRTFAALWSVACLLFALFNYMSLEMLGFPDGGITPYDRQTRTLMYILTAACGLQGMYFALMAFFSARLWSLWMCMMAVSCFTVLPLLMIEECSRIGICRTLYEQITHSHMDDGEGG